VHQRRSNESESLRPLRFVSFPPTIRHRLILRALPRPPGLPRSFMFQPRPTGLSDIWLAFYDHVNLDGDDSTVILTIPSRIVVIGS